MISTVLHSNRKSARPSTAEVRKAKPKILTIDDDPDIARAIETILSAFDVDVICNYNGQQGIWNSITEKPDLIITDWMMPCGAGEDLVCNLRRNRETAHTPVIVLSCLGGTRMRKRLATLGVTSCLRKPIDRTQFLDEIRRHIDLPPLSWVSTEKLYRDPTNAMLYRTTGGGAARQLRERSRGAMAADKRNSR